MATLNIAFSSLRTGSRGKKILRLIGTHLRLFSMWWLAWGIPLPGSAIWRLGRLRHSCLKVRLSIWEALGTENSICLGWEHIAMTFNAILFHEVEYVGIQARVRCFCKSNYYFVGKYKKIGFLLEFNNLGSFFMSKISCFLEQLEFEVPGYFKVISKLYRD